MAYYSSSYAGSDFGEYNSYAVNYDYARNPSFMAYNDQEFNKPYYGYDQSLYCDPTPPYPALSYPTISYSANTFSEPKFIEYDPNYGESQLVIYYSTMEFNDPEFDEYDPTPYGGGYDIAQTYGKPLPPSDETCYPRSGSDPNALPAGSIVPMPTVDKGTDEKAIIPQNGSAGQVTDQMPLPELSLRDLPEKEEDKILDTQGLNPYVGEDNKEQDDDNYFSGSGSRSGYGNGYSGGHYDEYEKQVPPQYPSGYGLEAMDLCESLFGYWPCLSRGKKRENCCEEVSDDIEGGYYCKENMWKGTADYLFGSPYPYDGGRGEEGSRYGEELAYAYQRSRPTQAQQVEYNENSSW